MNHARVFEHSQQAAQVNRNANPGSVTIEPPSRRSSFTGLFLAALIATPFWVVLALLILRFR